MYTLALEQSGSVNETEVGEVVQTMREALGAVAPDHVHDLVLALALRKADLSEVPERGRALRTFVVGALYFAIQSAVGAVAAEMVSRELLRVLGSQMAKVPHPNSAPSGSGVRARADLTSIPDDDDAAARATLPVRMTHREVILVSRDRLLAKHVDNLLGGAIRLHIASDAAALMKCFTRLSKSAPLILLDCTPPGVSASTLAELGRPTGSVVVAWGTRALLDAELSDARQRSWSRCHSDEGPEALELLLGGLCEGVRDPSSSRSGANFFSGFERG